MNISNYCKNSNDTKNINNKKTFIGFINYCYNNIKLLRNISDKIKINDNWNKKLHIVFIEFEKLPHMEFLIRNAIIKTEGLNKYSIICGEDNYNMIKSFNIKNLNIINKKLTNITEDQKNLLMGYSNFWEELDGEYILICKKNSIIFNNNIEKFFKYDYIGSSWFETKRTNIMFQGAGGLSLRNKNKMIQICKISSIVEMSDSKKPVKFMKKNNLTICPEDVYFCQNLLEDPESSLPIFIECNKFCIENFNNRNPFGGNNFYRFNWEKNLNYDKYIDEINEINEIKDEIKDEKIKHSKYSIVKIPKKNELMIFNKDDKVLRNKYYHSDFGKDYVKRFENKKISFKKSVKKCYKNVVICAKRYDFNWRHFLLETFFDMSLGYKTENVILITEDTQRYVLEILNILNIRNYYEVKNNDIIYCDNIISNDEDFEKIKNVFLSDLITQSNNLYKINMNYFKDLKFYNKIFLTRNNSNKKYRYVSNQNKLNNILKEQDYFFFEGGKVPLYQQISLINNAKSIVTQIGANCDNILFCNNKCKFSIIYAYNSKTWAKYYKKFSQCKLLYCGNKYEKNGNKDKYNWNYTIDFSLLKI
jgi:hypothetical protein